MENLAEKRDPVIAHGYHCGLENDPNLYRARLIFDDPEVFGVGCHFYGPQLEPLSHRAPKIEMCWNPATETKMQYSAWKWRKYKLESAKVLVLPELPSEPKDVTPIRSLPRSSFLRLVCQRCGRSRAEQVGFVIDAGRFGGRTVWEFGDAAICTRWDCQGRQKVMREG